MSSPEGAAGAARAERELVFVNARQVVTCAGPPTARRGAEMSVFQVIEDGAVAVRGERIAAVGPRRDLEQRFRNAERVDCASGIVTPALVDSHTHAIFGAPRANEHEMRAAGLDYMEIARRGGGIHSSVRDVRGRTESDLLQLARKRVRRLSSFGVGTIEMKSGYGLTLEDELKMLRVIRALQAELPVRIVATFLGAHEIPLEHRHSSAARREYVDALVHEMIPRVTQERLATFADVFCEPGVYTIDESREVLTAARAAGRRIKLDAGGRAAGGGAELAAELEATSADHLAAVSDEGIKALASVGTVATLLPSTMLFLGKPGQAPARRMIAAGLPIALATDFNPGTSPTVSLPLVLTLGVSHLRLTAAEAIA